MPIKVSWWPLFPGENPGDPELGGWRPLHLGLLRRLQPDEGSETIDLLTAIKKLGHIITYRNLQSAIAFIGSKITVNN